jgi:hypothetical protein
LVCKKDLFNLNVNYVLKEGAGILFLHLLLVVDIKGETEVAEF